MGRDTNEKDQYEAQAGALRKVLEETNGSDTNLRK